MRFRRLEIAAFGGLRDLSSGSGDLGDFVVVEGPNEAGKSTLFEFLCTLLYGIYPTSSERHPHAPWNGAELAGRGVIETADGAVVEVTRRLLSTPSATLMRGGRSESLRNDDLPFVSHVPQKVFRQVFALTLAELASLQDEGWDAVQDRILGRLGATDLRPAREVIEELEAEARALWRPDRRGNPRVRSLGEAIRIATGRRPEVRARSAGRRADAARLLEIRRVLESARNTRLDEQARLTRLRALIPVRTELAHIAELHLRAGDAKRLEGLPADPVRELDYLSNAVAEAHRELQTLATERAGTTSEIEACTLDDTRILEREIDIEGFRSRVAAAEPVRARREAVEQEVRSLDRRLHDEIDQLPWRAGPDLAALVDLPRPVLTQALARWEEAWRRQQAAAEVPRPPLPPQTRGSLLGWALVLGAVVVGIAAGLGRDMLGAGALLPLGVLAVTLGALGLREIQLRRRQQAAAQSQARAVAQAGTVRADAERDARAAVAELLDRAGLLVGDTPDPLLSTRIDRCRQWLRDRDDLEAELRGARTLLDDLDAEARELATLSPNTPTAEAAGTAALLQARLNDARVRAAAAQRAMAQGDLIDRRIDDATQRMNGLQARLSALETTLRAFSPDDPRAGAQIAAHCLAAAREAEQRALRLQAEHPDLDELTDELARARSEGAAWVDDPDPISDVHSEIDALSQRIEEWRAREADLESRLTLPDGEETPDQLEGEILRLREERSRLRREYDRLWILSRVVEEADLRVRELHQPEILRRAGTHLAQLTDGRYTRVEVAGERSRTLRVSGPALPAGIDVGPPLSTGTREQIYIALRLALVDRLDDDGPRLPLFLDEVFVNWDARRRRAGLDLLQSTSRQRQVFLFTCHPHLAEEAVTRGATRWRLDGP